MGSCRQAVLVAVFFVLCFALLYAADGRKVRNITQESSRDEVDKGLQKTMAVKADGDDFESSDYSPARKKTPIHN
ncbi:hypothetical protein MLD38_009341 [Melastoma candidum]|uniref:Uncharacterized protein n=1 Tax=Melastoma candidum TaxID=119954 RepID=A0ACB9RXS8_9MYRT|nr:hypothetical protein MLD38_009341 [Melastoma candidum]